MTKKSYTAAPSRLNHISASSSSPTKPLGARGSLKYLGVEDLCLLAELKTLSPCQLQSIEIFILLLNLRRI
ncbi:unnamed protein product [Arctia plantaginis]|uniref:Uncharacterized protein n=1 Tax=Arctia plantaginis TaxID=874455 RepID=A0A8S0YT66_ARCPL|nr:unnamed protein product [Arctia plantaginis]